MTDQKKSIQTEKKENANSQKLQSLANLNFDSLRNVKIEEKDLIESKSSNSKSIYKESLISDLGSEERKQFRNKIRRQLRNFKNDILGKDRTDEERKGSVLEFCKFYEKYWKIQDFKIENFTNSRNEQDLKDYRKLLNIVKQFVGM